MALLEIVKVGDRDSGILNRSVNRVRDFGPTLHTLLDNMLETMREAPGVGLAAPQVGIDLRASVIEYPDDEDDPENTMRVYELINPEVIKARGNEVGQEGCLSIPGLVADVERPTYVLIRAQDRFGKEYRLKAYDWLARVFLHEIDHLHGVLMTDKAEQLYKIVENEEGEFEAVPIDEAIMGNVRLQAKLQKAKAN
ncbi:MAG: peptide deformylase [Caldilineaceae bacterium]|nr:peptide deformylase [Caldilineaceae bacterium]